MSSQYELVSFVVEGVEPAKAVGIVDEVIRARGGVLAVGPGAFLLLEKTNDEPLGREEPVHDAEAALARVAGWPTGGLLKYDHRGARMAVVFAADRDAPGFSVISITAPGSVVAARAELVELGRTLHQRLGAARTVVGVALDDVQPEGWERRELKRLRRGEYQDAFPLLDLRK